MIFSLYSCDNRKFLPRFFQKAKGIAFFGRRKSLVAILGTTSPWQDFKGGNPLTPQNSKQNLRKQILAIFLNTKSNSNFKKSNSNFKKYLEKIRNILYNQSL